MDWHYELFFEIVLSLLAPYPNLEKHKLPHYNKEFDATIYYSLNQVLLFICFNRVYHLGRALLFITKFMNPRSQRLCQMNNCTATPLFALRGLMKEYPY